MINLLNAISMGLFRNNLDHSEYYKLFHLQLVVQTNIDLNISIEKNKVINMIINPQILQISNYQFYFIYSRVSNSIIN